MNFQAQKNHSDEKKRTAVVLTPAALATVSSRPTAGMAAFVLVLPPLFGLVTSKFEFGMEVLVFPPEFGKVVSNWTVEFAFALFATVLSKPVAVALPALLTTVSSIALGAGTAAAAAVKLAAGLASVIVKPA